MARKSNIFGTLLQIYRAGAEQHRLIALAEQRGVNVSEDAAILLNSASAAVRKILDRRAAMDAEGRQNDPLIVLAGETHNNIPDAIHHALVLDGLRPAEQSLGVCFEKPHGFLAARFTRHCRISFPDADLIKAIKDRDPMGHTGLRAAHSKVPYAEYRYLYDYVLHHGFPVAFNDTANVLKNSISNKVVIDHEDRSSADAMKACSYPVAGHYNVVTGQGMHIRNTHMERLGREFAIAQDLRILYQHTGNGHVRGFNRWDAKAEQSLGALYKRVALGVSPSVLAIISPLEKHFSLDDIPRDYSFHPNEVHETDHGLRRAYREPYKTAYINALLPEIGLGDFVKDGRAAKALQAVYAKETSALFSQWKTELGL